MIDFWPFLLSQRSVFNVYERFLFSKAGSAGAGRADFNRDVQELLPVYMVMYVKYSPFYDMRFCSYTSLAELVELAGTFGKDCQHRRYYNRAAEAVEFLGARGVIVTDGYDKAKATKPFKYRFKDLNEVFGKDEKDGKFGYASLSSNEYFCC